LVQGAFNQCEHSISGYAIEGEKVPEGDRLIWTMDYRYLCRTLDDEQWQELVRLAERHEISAVICAALDQARALSEDCVPKPVFAQLADRQQGGKVMSYLTQASRRRRIASDLAASRGIGDKVSYVLRLMLPNDDHLRSTFPHARNSPKFLLRLRWLVRAMFRHLKPDSA
ncbi:MAG: hypothetical protein P1U62_14830, partial [Alteraurantiacibacter sp. bin_em_oilr2.035]|nr:hypothetical protein [Alteraurantiacibacter sp. bin_em_oilr2.035]